MATASEIWSETVSALIGRRIRDAWKALDRVPDCPQCKGSGNAGSGFDVVVFWRGQEVCVCATCEGSGKV